jgi:pyruvate dehydrogenase E2 component (dihydrolipoamide acetyltransferase)
MGISVKRIGSTGPVRVLLHGFASNAGTFLPILPFLSAKGSLILIDLPAHGHSAVPLAPPKPETMARAVVDALSERNIESFQLIGHSLGALIATHVAIAMADKVAGLCLISSAGVGPEINLSFFLSMVTAQSPEELHSHLAVAYHQPPVNLGPIARTIFAWLQKPGVKQYLSMMIEHADAFSADVQGAVTRGIPTSALWGAKDSVLPIANARALPAEVPLLVLPHAGHTPHMEAPAEVASWILAATFADISERGSPSV